MTPEKAGNPPAAVAPPPEICILMGLYNGAAYLQEQLESFAAQTHGNWSLIVSDDGSGDDGPAILSAFRARHRDRRILCRPGPQRGFSGNFLSLLQSVPSDVPYAALSDQDDVWFPDKLERALNHLQTVPADQPALYCARTMICDEALTPLHMSGVFQRPPDFRNALVQSIGGGNTMMLNRAALDLVSEAAATASDPVAHDWWLYQMLTGCGGTVIRDPEPALYYRQHAHNAIGANQSARARLTRIYALLNGRFRDWNTTGLAALAGPSGHLTPDAREIMQTYAAARTGNLRSRLRALRHSGVYRQSRLGTTALYIACVLRRL